MSRTGLDRLDLAAIAIGGVAGASLRWLVTRADVTGATGGWFRYAPNTALIVGENALGRSAETMATAATIPIDTLVVNVGGCLMLGVLTVLLWRSVRLPRRALLAAASGFCGSLTTFSTFAVELAVLLRGRPLLIGEVDGIHLFFDNPRPVPAFTYLALSLVGGALAFWLGRCIAGRLLMPPPGARSTQGGA